MPADLIIDKKVDKQLYLLAITWLLFILPSWAQNPHWLKEFHTGGQNFNATLGALKGIAMGQNGKTYITGKYKDTITLDSFGFNVNNTNWRFFIAEVDDTGSVVWAKSSFASGSSTSASHSVQNIEVDAEGNIIVAGGFKSEFMFDTASLSTVLSYHARFVMKLDSVGNMLWIRTIPVYQYDQNLDMNTDLSIDPMGNIYLAGGYWKELIWDTTLFSAGSYFGSFLGKLSPEGELGWIKGSYTNSSMNSLANNELIQADQNYNIYHVTGLYGDDAFDTISLDPAQHVFLISKWDSAGSLVWTQKVPRGSQQEIFAMNVTDSVLYLLGETGTNFELDSTTITSSTGDAFLARFSTDFDLDTVMYCGSIYTGSSNGINKAQVILKNGRVYIAGMASGSLFFGTSTIINSGVSYQFAVSMDEESLGVRWARNDQPLLFPQISMGFIVDNEEDLKFFGFIRSQAAIGQLTLTGAYPYDTYYLYALRDCADINASLSIQGSSSLCSSDSAVLFSGEDMLWHHQWFKNNISITSADSNRYVAHSPGNYQVVVSDQLGCSDTSSAVTLTYDAAVQASISLSQTQFCVYDAPIGLAGAPAGGTFSGNGVSGNTFNPAVAGPGNHFIYYSVSDSTGCEDSALAIVNVSLAPSVFFFPSFTTACTDDTITLNSGFPSGGTYSGPGVIANQLFTTMAGAGTHSLAYTYASSDGCTAMDSISITITSTPVVSFNLPADSTCGINGPIPLTGQSPAGGIFGGTGISGNYFIPQIVDPGLYTITYSLTQNGCTGTAHDTIRVDSFPAVTLPALDSICLSATVYSLDHGLPTGGMYSGTGITNNIFDASVAGTGTHAVMYVYENGCGADTAYNTITVIANPTIGASVTDVSCNALADGALTALVSGGNGPYNFAWSSGGSAALNPGLTAGTYTVTATGEGGCVAQNTFVVAEPAPLVLSLDSLDDVVCNGFSDGMAYVSTSGGTAAYTWLWSGGQTTEDVLTLTAGTHSLTVTDAMGCRDSLEINIAELNPVVLNTVSTDITCKGYADGSASTVATGGGGIYTFAWSNSAATGSIASLDSGEYYLSVTDQNGCEALDTVLIAEPDSLVIFLLATNISCHGNADGSLGAVANGGNGGYSFAWNTGAVSDSIPALTAGVYSLTVNDANGCSAVASDSITQPDSLHISLSVGQPLLCFGDTNGQLSASVTGGVLPYGFLWSEGSASAAISGLAGGMYTLTVTDANGCQKTAAINLANPALLTVVIDSAGDPGCFGSADGFIQASVSGGTGSHVFLWNTGASSALLSGLGSGTYILTVTDAMGCTATISSALIEPAEIGLSLSAAAVSCFGGNDGAILASVSNTQGAPVYSWSNGSSSALNAGLGAGVYVLVVTDSAGCQQSDTATVNQPTALSVTLSTQNNLCFGDATGSASASVSGGVLPYTYLWSNGAAVNSIGSLTAGSYTLTITDSNGCVLDTSLMLSQPAMLALTVDSLADLLCFGDSSGYAEVSASGGTGSYSFSWSDGGSGSIRADLSAVGYSVTVTDANGCEDLGAFLLGEPAVLTAAVDSVAGNPCFGDSLGAILASAGGGTGAYTFNWSNGQQGALISGLPVGTYTLTVTDVNGCETGLVEVISQPAVITFVDTVTDAHCDNSNDGSVSVSVSGGVPPFLYAWSNAVFTASNPGLPAGTYTLSVADANGCLHEDSYVVGFGFPSPSFDLGADTGFCSGDLLFLEAAGAGDFYLWSTGDSTLSVLVSTPGDYALTVTDSSGCFSSDTVSVEEFLLPVFSLGSDSLICMDSMIAGVTLFGPAGMDVYSWSTGGATSSEVVFQFGVYSLSVTDFNGCKWMDSIAFAGDTCLGIRVIRNAPFFSVFPNPSLGIFNVSSSLPASQPFMLNVFNAQGVVVRSLSVLQQTSFDLSDEGAGIYLIRAVMDGKASYVRVVVL